MKNTLYGIGLDIGVASVGWAVVGLNSTGEPVGLHRLGVRVFDKAEQPKTGESLAAPRRMARGMRRRIWPAKGEGKGLPPSIRDAEPALRAGRNASR